jgi:hypothetical protein
MKISVDNNSSHHEAKFTCNPSCYFEENAKVIEGVRVMVFNVTFHNISVIFWRSVLLVEETGETHRPAASH